LFLFDLFCAISALGLLFNVSFELLFVNCGIGTTDDVTDDVPDDVLVLSPTDVALLVISFDNIWLKSVSKPNSFTTLPVMDLMHNCSGCPAVSKKYGELACNVP